MNMNFYRICTPIFFRPISEGHREWKILENRIKTSLVPETKIVKRPDKISGFRNLMRKNSHVPVFSKTSPT